MAAFSHSSFVNGNVYERSSDDTMLIFCYLFPPELSEEEAEDVLFKEVGCLFFEASETLHYILGF